MKRVGVLRGGTDKNYMSSLAKGGDIIAQIFENLGDKYKVVDILIDRDGVWHINGLPIAPADLIHKVDIVWNTIHPSISTDLNNLSIPNVSIGSFSDVLGNSKEMLREHMKKIGVQMPRHLVLPVYQKDFDGPRERYAIKKAKEVHEKFPAPWIVKSFTEEKNMGIHLAKTFPELVDAIEDGVKHEKSILVEEFITGKIASIHSVPNFRGEDMYTFPLGNTYGDFSPAEKEELVRLAKDIHNHIGATHYLKSDFVRTPRGKMYLLNIESSPDFQSHSHLSQVALSVGAEPHHIIEHILEQAF